MQKFIKLLVISTILVVLSACGTTKTIKKYSGSDAAEIVVKAKSGLFSGPSLFLRVSVDGKRVGSAGSGSGDVVRVIVSPGSHSVKIEWSAGSARVSGNTVKYSDDGEGEFEETISASAGKKYVLTGKVSRSYSGYFARFSLDEN